MQNFTVNTTFFKFHDRGFTFKSCVSLQHVNCWIFVVRQGHKGVRHSIKLQCHLCKCVCSYTTVFCNIINWYNLQSREPDISGGAMYAKLRHTHFKMWVA
jgi:hypothetical protein